MHELSIALSILDVATEEAERQAEGGRIAAIHLRLGPLSGVIKEALVSAYNLAREQTPLATAELAIEEVPLVTFCTTCAAECKPTSTYALCCPTCGTPTPEILSGRQLEVVALEVEP
jgi:hydrogenase nickel incorporation protein HypA/HybF